MNLPNNSSRIIRDATNPYRIRIRLAEQSGQPLDDLSLNVGTIRQARVWIVHGHLELDRRTDGGCFYHFDNKAVVCALFATVFGDL